MICAHDGVCHLIPGQALPSCSRDCGDSLGMQLWGGRERAPLAAESVLSRVSSIPGPLPTPASPTGWSRKIWAWGEAEEAETCLGRTCLASPPCRPGGAGFLRLVLDGVPGWGGPQGAGHTTLPTPAPVYPLSLVPRTQGLWLQVVTDWLNRARVGPEQ